MVSRDDVPQLSKIIATHSLTVIETTAPELPEGVDKDPVSKQEDLAEFSDVYGMVKLGLEANVSSQVVKFHNQRLIVELAIGDIKSNGNSKSVEVHKVPL